MRKRIDQGMRHLFLISAVVVSIAILSIILFVGYQGLQSFKDVSAAELFLSADWTPSQGRFGLAAFLLSTAVLTVLSVALAVPLAVSGAIFAAKISPRWIREMMRPATDLFVGIPSVVYGLIGLTVLVPFFRNLTGTTGYGILPAAVVLAIMIFPTILSIGEDALRSLPPALEEASLALGATRWQTIRRVLLPAARSGLATGIGLGMGRAIGETMAVLMVIGNAPQMPESLLDSTTVLTTAIMKDMTFTAYGSAWNNVLYFMALLLLLISLFFIVIIRIVSGRREFR